MPMHHCGTGSLGEAPAPLSRYPGAGNVRICRAWELSLAFSGTRDEISGWSRHASWRDRGGERPFAAARVGAHRRFTHAPAAMHTLSAARY